jgi:hypothetical protein
MDIFFAATILFFVAVLSFILLCAPRHVGRVGIFFGGGRAFGMAFGVVALICLAAQAVAWAFTAGGEIYGVPPVVFFALYSLGAFCLRGGYLWYSDGRQA